MLRSAYKWCAGIFTKEEIQFYIYYHLIDNSKHYLHIENQFFVSRAFSEEERKEYSYSLSDVV